MNESENIKNVINIIKNDRRKEGLFMTKVMYLCSLSEHVGKSLLSIGIMLKLQREGKKVAYFKPIGIPKGAFSDKADRDVGFIQSTVFKTTLPYDIISPVSIPDCYYVDLIDSSRKEEHLNSIKRSYDELEKDFDYIIIEGAPSIKRYIRVGLDDITIAQKLDFFYSVTSFRTETDTFELDMHLRIYVIPWQMMYLPRNHHQQNVYLNILRM